jgi:hypothetical protein
MHGVKQQSIRDRVHGYAKHHAWATLSSSVLSLLLALCTIRMQSDFLSPLGFGQANMHRSSRDVYRGS